MSLLSGYNTLLGCMNGSSALLLLKQLSMLVPAD